MNRFLRLWNTRAAPMGGRDSTSEPKTFVRQQNYEIHSLHICRAGDCPAGLTTSQVEDPLPSWNDGTAKQAIVYFVQTTRETGGTNFVPAEEHIDSTHARIITAAQLHIHP